MSGSARESLSDVRKWLRGPPGFSGVVVRPSRMSGSGREVLPDFRSGREALSNVREWSGGPPRSPRVAGRPSQMSGRDREALPDVWE